MPADPVDAYLAAVQKIIQLGNPTEHTYRPALKALFEALAPGVTATNEPKHVKVGAPDYVITRESGQVGPLTVGHVEAKDVPVALAGIESDSNHVNPTSIEGRQLKRYRGAFPNLLFTNYLEFHRFVDGEPSQQARLGKLVGAKVTRDLETQTARQLILDFLNRPVEHIGSAQELAKRMARLTHLIRDMIVAEFEDKSASDLLVGWRQAFAKVLISDLEQPEKVGEFADMFAQTLAYGLFSARVMDPTPGDFSRQEAQSLIPRTNPFLRRFFEQISGNQMAEEPYAPYVDDLVTLLRLADMEQVLKDFGKKTRQEDPVVHFYETFLAAYDPRLREARGVYYTPEPVVSYIVRSVDHILRTSFKLPDGLADSSKIAIENPNPQAKDKALKLPAKIDVHRVLVLDPATGTGTFPYAVVDLIRRRIGESNAGSWSNYVREHLLPRIFGFELLMAPYAVAHFKLAFQLAAKDLPPAQQQKWAYNFAGDERINVFLTNALEGPSEHHGLPLFVQWVADETNQANRIKQDLPIMVVMGNPPYSGHSANKGEWISKLVRDYYFVDGQPLGEKNSKWLQDDYVKFIRLGQWRIEKSGGGILAFISNNGYLDNPTFRGMRQSLLNSFSDIYILNLHGNSKKREVAPDGSTDQNVFDIQQGVAIALFIKEPNKKGPAQVHYADLWGIRENKQGEGKYPWLLSHDVSDTDWSYVAPQQPFYLFLPQNNNLQDEYNAGSKITDFVPVYSMGVVTSRDRFEYSFTQPDAQSKLSQLIDISVSDEYIRQNLLSKDDKLPLSKIRPTLRRGNSLDETIGPAFYRPFDSRWLIYANELIERARLEVMQHFQAKSNYGLHLCRQVISETWQHIMATDRITDSDYVSNKTRERGYTFPFYLYPPKTGVMDFAYGDWKPGPSGRRPNLNPQFVAELEQKLGAKFVADGKGDLDATFGPEDIFNYIYAVFHSPTYRERYAEFLKIDFPRVPLTSDKELFRTLAGLGGELVALHLMEQQAPAIASYPEGGDDKVEKVAYAPPQPGETNGAVWINKTQYFGGIAPAVWEFQIGGYQVAEKWLKDRKGRKLSYDDQRHYQRTVAALAETMRLMARIDEAIPGWPIE